MRQSNKIGVVRNWHDSFLPLQDIKIISLATNLPGPVACAKFAKWGARILKLESPKGDLLEHYYPEWYRELHKGQKIFKANLQTEEGRALLFTELENTDLILSATRPKNMARLGLTPESLQRRFPKLCFLGIIAYPYPHEDRPGHDLNFQAEAGLLGIPPKMPVTTFADLMGAEQVVSEALAQLWFRLQHKKPSSPRWISLNEAALRFTDPLRFGACGPEGPLGGAIPTYALYFCKDKKKASSAESVGEIEAVLSSHQNL